MKTIIGHAAHTEANGVALCGGAVESLNSQVLDVDFKSIPAKRTSMKMMMALKL